MTELRLLATLIADILIEMWRVKLGVSLAVMGIVAGFLMPLAPVQLPAAQAQTTRASSAFERYRPWFHHTALVDDIDILATVNIDEAPNKPPTVVIPKSQMKDGAPEKITFTLVRAFASGGGTRDWIHWLIFDAKDQNNEALPGLYLFLNDKMEKIIHYNGNQSAAYTGGFECKQVLNTTLTKCPDDPAIVFTNEFDRAIDTDSLKNLFSYVLNLPKTGNDCLGLSDSQMITTGPKPPATQKQLTRSQIDTYLTPPSLLGLPDLSGGLIESGLKNCFSIGPNGWLYHWGVTGRIQQVASECGIEKLVTGDVGVLITRVLGCFFFSIYDNIVSYLTDFLVQIGDLSAAPPPQAVASLSTKAKHFFIGTAHADPLHKEFGPPKTRTETDPTTGEVKTIYIEGRFVAAWAWARSIVNIAVVIALLAIAFANILHLNINTYTAKQAIPKLAIGVIGANASLLLCRFLLDVAQAMSQWAVDFTGMGIDSTISLVNSFMMAVGLEAIETSIPALVLTTPLTLIVIIVAITFYVFLMLVLAWMLIKRLIFLYFLIILSPLAFLSYGIPNFQQYFGRWWSSFLGNLFAWPILLFGMALVIKLNDVLGFSDATWVSGDNLSLTGLIESFILFAAAIAVIKIPGMIGGKALDIYGAAEKAFGYARNAPATVASWGQGGTDIMQRRHEAAYKNALARAKDRTLSRGVRRAALAEARSSAMRANVYKSAGKQFGAARGWSHLTTHPDIAGDWWKTRLESGERASSVETAKLNVPGLQYVTPSKRSLNLGDIVSGKGGYKAKIDDARKRAKENIETLEGVRDFIEGSSAGKDLLKAVKKIEDRYRTAGDTVGLTRFQAQVVEAKTPEKMEKLLAQLVAEDSRLGQFARPDLYSMAVLSAGYERALQLTRSARGRARQPINLPYGIGGGNGPDGPPPPPPGGGFPPPGGGGPGTGAVPYGTIVPGEAAAIPPGWSLAPGGGLVFSEFDQDFLNHFSESHPEGQIRTQQLAELMQELQDQTQNQPGSQIVITDDGAKRFANLINPQITRLGQLFNKANDPYMRLQMGRIFGLEVAKNLNSPKGIRGALDGMGSKLYWALQNQENPEVTVNPVVNVPPANQSPAASTTVINQTTENNVVNENRTEVRNPVPGSTSGLPVPGVSYPPPSESVSADDNSTAASSGTPTIQTTSTPRYDIPSISSQPGSPIQNPLLDEQIQDVQSTPPESNSPNPPSQP